MDETQFAVSYTDIELESYLPAGWGLAAGREPRWDGRKGSLHVEVVDMCDLTWDLVVSAAEVGKSGRIPALRQAVDTLNRKRFKTFI